MKKGLLAGIGAGIGAAGLAVGAGVATVIIKRDVKKAEEKRELLLKELEEKIANILVWQIKGEDISIVVEDIKSVVKNIKNSEFKNNSEELTRRMEFLDGWLKSGLKEKLKCIDMVKYMLEKIHDEINTRYKIGF